ncbi:MAG: hypothetical protein H0T61_12840, partial [Actinobacteria bacterium]|nr:hypothetical protein [Actinomycetota bacterium]
VVASGKIRGHLAADPEGRIEVARRRQSREDEYAEGVAMLVALRDDPPSSYFELAKLPTIRLRALAGTEAQALLEQSADDRLAPEVQRELVRAAAGVPLALVELPKLLTDAERAGREPLSTPLRVGGSVEAAFRPLVDALGEAEREALLVVAADDMGDADVIELALRNSGLAAEGLDAAAGIGAGFRFRHPLLRSLLYQDADPAARRRAHAALADALAQRGFEARSAWHRALAATNADSGVADTLADVAAESRSRGGFGPAAAAGERAARLTPDRELRATRLVAAAGDGQLAGQLERAGGLLEEALELTTDPLVRADAQELRARALLFSGRPMDSHALLVDQAERINALNPDKAALLLAQAVLPCQMAGWISRGKKTGERAVAVAARGGEQAQLVAAMALAQILVLSGDAAGATALRNRVRRHPRLDDPVAIATFLQAEAGHLMVLGEHEAAREAIEHLVALARGAAAPGLIPFALATQAEIDFRTGRWLEAAAAAAEAAELAAQTGQIAHVAYSLMILGRLHAACGRASASEQVLDEAAAIAAGLGIDAMRFYVPAARAFRALGLGDLEAAVEAALEVDEISRERGLHEPGVVLWPPDLIEALHGLGRTREARGALERFQGDADATGRLWALATASRCRGLLAEDDGFEVEFETALTLHEELRMPFERARTELCLGERLLRAGRAEARDHLRRALATFDRLGARPWSERAAARLRSAGEPASTAPDSPTNLLTEHELRVALAVATGASPQEAAAQLFLSTKTVDLHLRSLYGKLGVESGDELRRVLTAAQIEETGVPVPVPTATG